MRWMWGRELAAAHRWAQVGLCGGLPAGSTGGHSPGMSWQPASCAPPGASWAVWRIACRLSRGPFPGHDELAAVHRLAAQVGLCACRHDTHH